VITDGLDPLVTDRVLQVFRDEGVTGWDAEPVAAHSPTGSEVAADWPGLHRLVVRGWGGVVPPELLPIVEGPCPGCGRRRYQGQVDVQKVFSEDRWDGSDLFIVWPFPKYVWISPRAVSAIQRQRLTGATICSMDDHEAVVFAAGAELGMTLWPNSELSDAAVRELGPS
jgi:hypothetical protein